MYLTVERSGKLVISREKITDNLPVASGTRAKLQECLVLARLGYDNETYLLPGVPESENEQQAYDAVLKFRTLCDRKLQGLNPFTGEPRKASA